MTDPNPFQAPSAATRISHPSIVGPTLVTALVAAVLFAVPSIVRGIDPGVSCCWNCTAGILILFLGVLPAWMLWRQGPYFTGGHGFAAAFIGVGSGSGLGVLLQMIAPGMDKEALQKTTEQFSRQMVEELQRQGQQLPVPEAELRETIEGMFLAAPIPVALVGSVVAGFVGVLTLSLLMRRPPPAPPVNPWSNQQA